MEGNKSFALPLLSDLLKYIPSNEKTEILGIIDQAMSLTIKKVPKSKVQVHSHKSRDKNNVSESLKQCTCHHLPTLHNLPHPP